MSKQAVLLLCLGLLLCVGTQVTQGQTLWGYYPIHENDLKDYSGNEHHGTAVDGAATVLDGEREWVLALNQEPEKPSRVNCGTDDPAAGGQLTVSAWVYWQGGNGNWQGIAGKSFSYDDRSWILQLRDTDGRIQWGGSDRLNLHIFADAAPAVGEWQHLVGTCDGTTSKVYINGEVVGEGPGGIQVGAAAANVTLGFGEDRSDYDESFNGRLDEIYILTRALSAAQVVDLAEGILPSFEKARDPDPADGATGVAMPLFRWTAGDGAFQHDVYLGTMPELGEAELVGPRSALPMFYYGLGLEPGETYYWRVDEIEKDGTIHTGDVWSFTTQALTAYLPSPADGANEASPTTTLVWQPGQNAGKHHLYLSDDADAVTQGTADADKGELTETTFTPDPLDPATVYYWRVDEIVAPAGSIVTGPVWTFMTFLPVDNFDDYTDDEGSRIYETWIDGYTNGLSGSTVGYIEAPFAEQNIVHDGGQSMPLDYNNVNSPFYSEAERQFDPVQDWTVNGINTLVLYVRGRTINAPDQLYVALEDASRHRAEVAIAEADKAVVTTTKWAVWRIPLAEFAGVDPARIMKMGIGLRSWDDQGPGGAGLVYIDDIRVIKVPPAE